MSKRNTTQAGVGAKEGAPRDARALAQRVEELCARLAPGLPEIERGDLVLIVQSLLRPIGTGRRFFLRPLSPGSRARVL
jgi:hypothetical protein